MGKGRRALAAVGTVAVAGALCGLAFFSKSSYPTVTVQLPANRAAGYTWVCSVKPEGSFVTVGTRYAPEDGDDPDGGGVETFVLQSRSQGTSQVSFACVDGDDGSIDSTATYEFTTEGSTIRSSGTTADISDTLMAPFEAKVAAGNAA
ncbi:protease inhibitor I42 family protein [Caniella muris]|uniref:protease inhibitor I42 family protein n=1 Tax=Caniella muris TaxID=2941502 RepID=UPI00203BC5C3|nr:protease inhibitor I42 family protein [Caniella muris]